MAWAVRRCGGQASLREIEAGLEDHPGNPKTRTWKATIRRVVRQYKIFEPVGTRTGVYRLVWQPEADKLLRINQPDPHAEQQGMLLALGARLGYETFVNKTDRTMRRVEGVSLADFATVRNDQEALASLQLKRVRNLDVLWLKSDQVGLYPAHAFEVEHSTRVRSGLERLLKIPERYGAGLHIVGPGEEERQLFDQFLGETPFRQHAQRFHFHFYEDVAGFSRTSERFVAARTVWGV